MLSYDFGVLGGGNFSFGGVSTFNTPNKLMTGYVKGDSLYLYVIQLSRLDRAD